LFALAAATPAFAQFGWDAPPHVGGRIHPQQIEAMVRSMGFQPVANPRPRGPLWVTHAVDRNGQHVRVLIDGFTGRTIDVLRRPMPPQNVAYAPPPNFPQPDSGARFPQQFPPQANAPQSDYEEGPDYDYRDVPRNQRPADWPPSRPQVHPQQGPNVIPLDPRSENNRLPNIPKTNTAKKKETKEKKNDTTAALTSDKDKQKMPSPKARPADAPKADLQKKEDPKIDAQKKDESKVDPPKTAQTPKMPATDTQRAPDPQTTGVAKEVPTFDPPKKDQQPSAMPPMQTPF
jgi:hypothetical protein